METVDRELRGSGPPSISTLGALDCGNAGCADQVLVPPDAATDVLGMSDRFQVSGVDARPRNASSRSDMVQLVSGGDGSDEVLVCPLVSERVSGLQPPTPVTVCGQGSGPEPTRVGPAHVGFVVVGGSQAALRSTGTSALVLVCAVTALALAAQSVASFGEASEGVSRKVLEAR